MDVEAAANQTLGLQNAFQLLTLLQLTGYLWPREAVVKENSTHDFIIVGGGTAGLVLANGLSEIENINVLVIEAGGDPPLESTLPGLFPFQPNTAQDWKFRSQDDQYTGQSLKNNVFSLVQGKMLGGSSSLDHLLNVRGNPADYNQWAEAVKDNSWSWDGLYNYFLEGEKLEDEVILNSTYKQFHGTGGHVKIRRDPFNLTIPYLKSFEEIGYKNVLDINGNQTLGFAEPLYTVSDSRESTAYSCITPIKDRPNLHVLKNTLATKIIFKDNVAVGVEVLTSDNKTITYNAEKEIIVTAGAFNTPKLLMLSGIGPKEHLSSLGIEVISDLPVGQNLQDHVSVLTVHKMEKTQEPSPAFNPTTFPTPCFLGMVALNETQMYPDYQAIGLIIPHDSSALLPLLNNLLGYDAEICEAVYKANQGRNILCTLVNKLHPNSRGKVLLRTTNPRDDPLIYMGYFSDKSDLISMSAYLEDYYRVTNTSYFKSVEAEFLDFNLPECSAYEFGSHEFWKCYAVQLSGTVYHYSSTCSFGSVVDARLRVLGVSGLRVADASAMPYVVSGNIRVAVQTIAAKAVDLIKQDNNLV